MGNETKNVELIIGPMFSGKSDELIRRVRRAKYAQKEVVVFKPALDDRRASDTINSYDGSDHPAISVSSAVEILDHVDEPVNWVAIDEAQFFDQNLSEVVNHLALKGKRVMVAGLAADFRNESFGPMDDLLRDAEDVTRLNAACNVCGEDAGRTQRLIDGQPAPYDSEQVFVGEEEYEARCRVHHEVPGKPKFSVELR